MENQPELQDPFSPEATKFRWFEWRENPDTACNCDHCQYLMFGPGFYAPKFKDSYRDAERAWSKWELSK